MPTTSSYDLLRPSRLLATGQREQHRHSPIVFLVGKCLGDRLPGTGERSVTWYAAVGT